MRSPPGLALTPPNERGAEFPRPEQLDGPEGRSVEPGLLTSSPGPGARDEGTVEGLACLLML